MSVEELEKAAKPYFAASDLARSAASTIEHSLADPRAAGIIEKIREASGEFFDLAEEIAGRDGEPADRFRLEYCCPDCDEEWEDVYECAVDSDCPKCGARDITPLNVIDIESPQEESPKDALTLTITLTADERCGRAVGVDAITLARVAGLRFNPDDASNHDDDGRPVMVLPTQFSRCDSLEYAIGAAVLSGYAVSVVRR